MHQKQQQHGMRSLAPSTAATACGADYCTRRAACAVCAETPLSTQKAELAEFRDRRKGFYFEPWTQQNRAFLSNAFCAHPHEFLCSTCWGRIAQQDGPGSLCPLCRSTRLPPPPPPPPLARWRRDNGIFRMPSHYITQGRMRHWGDTTDAPALQAAAAPFPEEFAALGNSLHAQLYVYLRRMHGFVPANDIRAFFTMYCMLQWDGQLTYDKDSLVIHAWLDVSEDGLAIHDTGVRNGVRLTRHMYALAFTSAVPSMRERATADVRDVIRTPADALALFPDEDDTPAGYRGDTARMLHLTLHIPTPSMPYRQRMRECIETIFNQLQAQRR